MNYRMNKAAIIAVVLLLVLAGTLFAYMWWSGGDDEAPSGGDTDQQEQENGQDDETQGRLITAMHDYVDGGHIVAGDIDLPTPCHRLNAETFFIDGDERNVEIRFTATNESEEACAQVITPARFKVTFEAPEDASIQATFDGEPARLNMVEVPEGEDLEDFELFIKG